MGFFFFFPFKTILSFPVLKKVFVVVSSGDVNISSKRQLSRAVQCIMIWSPPYNSYSLPGLLIYRTLVCEWQKKKEREREIPWHKYMFADQISDHVLFIIMTLLEKQFATVRWVHFICFLPLHSL